MAKTPRLNLRCTPEIASLLREAAEAQGQELTSCVLGPALDLARQVVAEDRVLRLSPPDIQLLEQSLEREGPVPELARLFAKVNEFDRDSMPAN